MFLPIWAIATIIYIAVLVITVFAYDSDGGIYMPDFTIPVFWVLETFAYLIFWIIYLAVT